MNAVFEIATYNGYSSRARDKFSTFVDFVVVFLMLSQGISIAAPFLGFYFPNEKLSFIIVCLFCLLILKNNKFPLSFFVAVCCSSVAILAIVYLRSLFYGISINRTDFNFALCFISYLFYFIYFEDRWLSILSLLPIIALLAVIFSMTQNVLMNFGGEKYALFLHNYYSQENYQLAQSSLKIFYRTNSFFTESSSLGLFYSFYLSIFLFSNFSLAKKKYHKIINLLVFVDIFMTFSSASILVLTIMFLFNLRKILPKVNKLLVIVVLVVVTVFIAGSIYEKIRNTLLLDSSYPRMLSIINNFYLVVNNYFWTGVGPSWEQPSWDIFSIVFTYYGMLGILVVVPLMCYLLSKCTGNLRIVNIGLLVTIGTPMNGLNIFVLIFSIILTRKYKSGLL